MNDQARSLHARQQPLPRAARALFAALSRLRYGRLELIGPGGASFSFPGALPGPDAEIQVQDWKVAADLLPAGDMGFAEAYLQGRWQTPELTDVLTLVALNHGALEQALYGRWWDGLLFPVRHLLHATTRSGTRRNIHSHYDLDNDFYRRWLDQTMTYSSALFGGDWSRSLEDAQTAKYERILRVVNPKPGEQILEIGCGWGGFAEYAARTRGCPVHGITVSRRQLAWAQERTRRAGLDPLVRLEYRDYRDLQGEFDHVVSIEMYETVGERSWPAYFDAIARRLKRGGRAVVQAIVIADDLFHRYRRSADFIQQYISPNAMLASPTVFARYAQAAGLEVRARHHFGADYAETLRRWQQGFNHAWPEIQGPGFDARFRRLWNFYLSYCEARFRAATTDVMQVEMSHVLVPRP
jgi:cyclopropane-fatty-acyl-phospholipid synthase